MTKSSKKKWVNLLLKNRTHSLNLPKYQQIVLKNHQVSKINSEILMTLTSVSPNQQIQKNPLLKNKLTFLISDKRKKRNPKKSNPLSNHKILKPITSIILRKISKMPPRMTYVILIKYIVSSDFATNVYSANNNYLDLLDSKADQSNIYGQQKP